MKFNNQNSQEQYASKFYYLESDKPGENNKTIQTIANLIHAGHIVVIPDDTTYIMACTLFNPDSIRALYDISNTSKEETLTMYISSLEMIKIFAKVSNEEFSTITKCKDSFWPGPLVIETEPSNNINKEITGIRKKCRFTISSNPIIKQLLALTMCPLVSLPAYFDGIYPCTSAEHINSEFKYYGIDLLVSDTNCKYGILPTIISLEKQTIHIKQLGPITETQIAKIVATPIVYNLLDFYRNNKYSKPYAIDKKYLLLGELDTDSGLGGMEDSIISSFKCYIENSIIIDFGKRHQYLSAISGGYVDLSENGDIVEAIYNISNVLFQIKDIDSNLKVLLVDCYSYREGQYKSLYYWLNFLANNKTIYVPKLVLDTFKEESTDDDSYIEDYPVIKEDDYIEEDRTDYENYHSEE
jgi:tRNA threonylcarbamoyl adenosine modification protein (Sua5/YciO/YrdC/YwlC family)